ncbi:hypothetical protein FE251_04745 [Georgenia wutianyii]|uniref:WXG100 family type VII secretion target n=1 Tax=Georgenia wutianyii TaxID=2585135 RepID=A0ABX5VM48_9MICO|nr:hypothetical protein [Georgenia wutianyii]QDB78761.1 hypothetical protein FE251_04745 [Georgenia wutianyii]
MSTFTALGFDPAPGSLGAAESVAEQVRTTASRIREAADVLGGTGRQDWKGETATAFHETMSEELTPRVLTAADSFETAATALATWASSLLTFQTQAVELESRAQAALAQVSAAGEDLTAAQHSEDPEADTDGPAGLLSAAAAELDSIRSEAWALADSYACEAEYVASCLADAGDAAPDSSWWDDFKEWAGDLEDWLQDYVLPVLEDLIDVLVVAVAVVAIIAMVLSGPVGWLGMAGLILGGAAVAIDVAQWAGGREDGTEALTGALGMLAGAGLGKAIQGLGSMAMANGGMSGLVPAIAGISRGTGGAGATATAVLSFNPVGPMATWGYITGRAYEESKNVMDTAQGLNDVGNPASRTVERFRNMFDGHGFVTAEQRHDIAERQGSK